jgi:hypothetical protein
MIIDITHIQYIVTQGRQSHIEITCFGKGKRNEELDQIFKTLYAPYLRSETYSILSTKTNVSMGD